jgi:hypothetical protein
MLPNLSLLLLSLQNRLLSIGTTGTGTNRQQPAPAQTGSDRTGLEFLK